MEMDEKKESSNSEENSKVGNGIGRGNSATEADQGTGAGPHEIKVEVEHTYASKEVDAIITFPCIRVDGPYGSPNEVGYSYNLLVLKMEHLFF